MDEDEETRTTRRGVILDVIVIVDIIGDIVGHPTSRRDGRGGRCGRRRRRMI
tara:strand:- start:176 stop:331 length:156 start_codon:yes stop_codon:yes gene_type:complete